MTGCVEGFVFRCVSEKEKNEKKDGRNKNVEKYKTQPSQEQISGREVFGFR